MGRMILDILVRSTSGSFLRRKESGQPLRWYVFASKLREIGGLENLLLSKRGVTPAGIWSLYFTICILRRVQSRCGGKR